MLVLNVAAVLLPLLTSVVTSAGMLTDEPGNSRGGGDGGGDGDVLDANVLAGRLEVSALVLLATRFPESPLTMPGNRGTSLSCGTKGLAGLLGGLCPLVDGLLLVGLVKAAVASMHWLVPISHCVPDGQRPVCTTIALAAQSSTWEQGCAWGLVRTLTAAHATDAAHAAAAVRPTLAELF